MALPSVAERFSAQRPKDNALYSDFLTNFNAHPDSKQLMSNKDEAAVIRSIKNLLLTNKYERLFQPTVGSNIQNYLFELASPQTQASIRTEIINTIENYEPRAKIIDVMVTGYPDKNTYVASITLYVTTVANAVTVNIPLSRAR